MFALGRSRKKNKTAEDFEAGCLALPLEESVFSIWGHGILLSGMPRLRPCSLMPSACVPGSLSNPAWTACKPTTSPQNINMVPILTFQQALYSQPLATCTWIPRKTESLSVWLGLTAAEVEIRPEVIFLDSLDILSKNKHEGKGFCGNVCPGKENWFPMLCLRYSG